VDLLHLQLGRGASNLEGAGGRGDAVLVWRRPGYGAHESTDHWFLYFVDAEIRGDLFRLTRATGEAVKVLGPVSLNSNFKIAAEGIYFIPAARDQDGRYYVKFKDFATGSVHSVTPLMVRLSWGLDVSPDGKWLVFAEYGRAGSDLMLVEGFR
jgi:hypothetical protein